MQPEHNRPLVFVSDAKRTALIAERQLLLQRVKHIQREIEAKMLLSEQLTSPRFGNRQRFLPLHREGDSPSGVPLPLDDDFSFGQKPKQVEDLTVDTPVSIHPVERDSPKLDSSALVIAMVGLPGRGKSFISTRLCRWLTWKGIPAACFNAGAYRRKELGASATAHEAYYDPTNKDAARQREEMARMACQDLVAFLRQNNGGVGILDATNTTKARREKLIAYFEGIGHVMFVESVCTDAAIIRTNILRAKCGNDDYGSVEPQVVLKDFYSRISQYEKVYESLSAVTEDHLTFVKMINVKTDVILHGISGHLQTMVAYFLLNLHLADQPVYLTRSGWSAAGEEGRMGHDGDLNEDGLRYALAVKRFMDSRLKETSSAVNVMSSPMKRAAQMASVFAQDPKYHVQEYPSLSELNYGDYKGKTKVQCERENPKTWERIRANPYLYCYPRGEGYKALARRLDPMFMELQRITEPTLVISHSSVLQVLRAYLTNCSPSVAHQTAVPLGCVIEVTQSQGNYVTTFHDLKSTMAEITTEQVLGLKMDIESEDMDLAGYGA